MTGIIVPDFLDIADRLASLDWPITLDQFPPHAATLGWTPTNTPDEYTYRTGGHTEEMSLTARGRIDRVFFVLVARGNALTKNNDAFVEAIRLARQHWGDPYRIDPGNMASMGWRFPNNCLVKISLGRIVGLRFYTPTGWYLY